MPKPAPAPNKTDTPRYIDNSVLECIYPADGEYRAVVTRDAAGLLHVRCEMWDTSEWDSSNIAFWIPFGQGATLTDTIENARILARERLRELGAKV